MARRPSNFRQQDVTRAINAAKRAGLSIVRIEIDPKTAKITVIIGEAELPPTNGITDEWADAIAEVKARALKTKTPENPWDIATMKPRQKPNPSETIPKQPRVETVSVVEAARRLGISRNHLYETLARGEFPALRIGRRWIISRIQLERFINGEKLPSALQKT
jgi:excisionase family DNA binding protein